MSAVFQFKIELLETSPLVWRRIQVSENVTFWDLHVAIQDAMGWTDTHLHAFEVEDVEKGRVEIGIPDPDGGADVVPGWTCKVAEVFRSPGDQLVYEYDFGDGWRHSILLEQIALVEPGARYPRCVEGARKCPPEDCGGPYRFAEFLQTVEDPGHPEHDEILEWCGGSFDAGAFDPAAVIFDDPEERRRLLD